MEVLLGAGCSVFRTVSTRKFGEEATELQHLSIRVNIKTGAELYT